MTIQFSIAKNVLSTDSYTGNNGTKEATKKKKVLCQGIIDYYTQNTSS